MEAIERASRISDIVDPLMQRSVREYGMQGNIVVDQLRVVGDE